ncbi:MAG: TetR/AcrR family transcriptional regulator [Myxococcales bacterium]|nr:TetR/AcrR family transcriptional regulator [Myxococcales bacterium]
MGVAERREREREQRRARIIDAAERVFFRLGPLASTMDDVAVEAELSKGTLYLYFKNKDDLYLAIACRGLSRFVERAKAVGDTDSGYEQLRRVLEAQHRSALAHPEHLKTMLAWMASGFTASPDAPGYDEYLALVTTLMGRLVAIVERGTRDGSMRADLDPVQVVMHCWGGSMGLWMLVLNRDAIAARMPVPCDFDALVPSYAEMILRAVAPRPDKEAP